MAISAAPAIASISTVSGAASKSKDKLKPEPLPSSQYIYSTEVDTSFEDSKPSASATVTGIIQIQTRQINSIWDDPQIKINKTTRKWTCGYCGHEFSGLNPNRAISHLSGIAPYGISAGIGVCPSKIPEDRLKLYQNIANAKTNKRQVNETKILFVLYYLVDRQSHYY